MEKDKRKKALPLAHLPANHLHYYLEGEDCLCDAYGTCMTEIGSTVVREEPLFTPAHIEKNLFHQHAYKCCTCEKGNGSTTIKKAPVLKPLISSSFGRPTMVTQTMIEKYVKKVPGNLNSDAYAAYEKISGIKNVYCWAHVRRKFHEAIGSQPKKYSIALLGERYCDLLFKEEKKLRHLDPTDRKKQRYQWIKPIVDEFFSWASNLCVLPRSKLGEAVAYLLKYKEGLCMFLEDGRLETTNDRAERAIKELVIGRKNWLFSKSEKGAQATGINLSILRTAVENGLVPRKYLIYLFEKIPHLPSLTKAALVAYLLWNQEIQEKCRANY
ncbi:IS66 family transposase [Enterococcus sp. DIV0756]|uniref:IS66 family transposase n=1 Tax=Enterococcus sp. DIV0756 TaxID=2774636 RepID=UPI003F271859